MADINSPVEIGVTTGPIRGSRKIHVGARTGSGIRVAMREIDLEGGEPSVRVYDTSLGLVLRKYGTVPVARKKPHQVDRPVRRQDHIAVVSAPSRSPAVPTRAAGRS